MVSPLTNSRLLGESQSYKIQDDRTLHESSLDKLALAFDFVFFVFFPPQQ